MTTAAQATAQIAAAEAATTLETAMTELVTDYLDSGLVTPAQVRAACNTACAGYLAAAREITADTAASACDCCNAYRAAHSAYTPCATCGHYAGRFGARDI